MPSISATPTTLAETAPRRREPRLPRRWLAIPAALAVLLVVLDRTTDLDRALTRCVYDPAAADFPLRGNFWLDVVLHHWAVYAVATLGCLALGALVLTYVVPALRIQRRLLLFFVLATGLAPLSVSAVKAATSRACPYAIDEFGGYAPYARLSDSLVSGAPGGHCFPAGHASTGFALMAFYFVSHRRKLRIAPVALAAGIAAGVGLGGVRVLQGAHFASHVAWAGLLCWLVMVALYAAVFRRDSADSRRRDAA